MRQVPQPRQMAAPSEPGQQTSRPRRRPGPPGQEQQGEAVIVSISIPLVVIVGVLVWAAWRFMGLRTWQAVLCLLLGFLLAATSAAPEISRAVTSINGLLSGR